MGGKTNKTKVNGEKQIQTETHVYILHFKESGQKGLTCLISSYEPITNG